MGPVVCAPCRVCAFLPGPYVVPFRAVPQLPRLILACFGRLFVVLSAAFLTAGVPVCVSFLRRFFCGLSTLRVVDGRSRCSLSLVGGNVPGCVSSALRAPPFVRRHLRWRTRPIMSRWCAATASLSLRRWNEQVNSLSYKLATHTPCAPHPHSPSTSHTRWRPTFRVHRVLDMDVKPQPGTCPRFCLWAFVAPVGEPRGVSHTPRSIHPSANPPQRSALPTTRAPIPDWCHGTVPYAAVAHTSGATQEAAQHCSS